MARGDGAPQRRGNWSGLSVKTASTPIVVEELRHLVADGSEPRSDAADRNVQSVTVRPASCAQRTISGLAPDDRLVRRDAARPARDLFQLGRPNRAARRPAARPAIRAGPSAGWRRSALIVTSSNDWMITGVAGSPMRRFFSSAAGEQHFGLHAAVAIERRILELGIETRLAAHEIDRFLERRDAGTGELRVEPRAGVEPLDLGQREVRRPASACSARPPDPARRDRERPLRRWSSARASGRGCRPARHPW